MSFVGWFLYNTSTSTQIKYIYRITTSSSVYSSTQSTVQLLYLHAFKVSIVPLQKQTFTLFLEPKSSISSLCELQTALMRYQLPWSVWSPGSEEPGQSHNLVIYGPFPGSRLIQSLPGYVQFIEPSGRRMKEWGRCHLDSSIIPC